MLTYHSASVVHLGRMAEWLIVPPWKGGIRKFRIEGSNPSPSAKYLFSFLSRIRLFQARLSQHRIEQTAVIVLLVFQAYTGFTY